MPELVKVVEKLVPTAGVKAEAVEVSDAVGFVTSVALISGLKASAILVQSVGEGAELTAFPLLSRLNHISRTKVSGVVPELVRL